MTEERQNAKQVGPENTADDLLLAGLKLDAVRSLAAGAAHNYNNIFGGLLGQLAVALRSDSSGEERETAHRLIDDLLQRGIFISTKLGQFSRNNQEEVSEVLPDVVVKEAVQVLRLLSSSHRIVARMESVPPSIKCRQHELLLALYSLGRQAIAALSEGGEVIFSVYEDQNGDGPVSNVVFSVNYQGESIPGKGQEHLFDPGQAQLTLTENRSTPPSLFLVKRFIDTHGGAISVAHDADSGTTFSFVLPGVQRRTVENAVPARTSTDDETEPAKNKPGVILLVEDEEAMRSLMTAALQKAGHVVFSVETGQEGIEEYAELHDTISAIVIDVGLPDATGPQCVRRLLEIDPGVAVLYVSGEPLDQNQLYPPASPLLLKPFTLDQLEKAVRDVIKK